MVANDVTFAGSIPDLYDRLMVPLIFQPYADDLAHRVAATAPRDVLETAAGTGVVTRALAAALPPQARIVATDLNPAMLACASSRPTARPVTWRSADALDLPFPDDAFDVVACQFGAMFFPDKVKGYGEARRVLRPGGRLLFSVWDRIEDNAFADVVTETLAEVFPDDPPRFLARTPHGHHDRQRIRADLAAAGFADVELETVSLVSRAESPRLPAVAYCQGTPLRGEIEARGSLSLAEATARCAAALMARYGSGQIEGPIRAVIVSAR